ncbi:MAG: hypothetical protein ACK517_01675, partial [bacterium]
KTAAQSKANPRADNISTVPFGPDPVSSKLHGCLTDASSWLGPGVFNLLRPMRQAVLGPR